jgi:hypothetical protein
MRNVMPRRHFPCPTKTNILPSIHPITNPHPSTATMAIIEELPDDPAPAPLPNGLKNQHLSLETMIQEAASAHFGKPVSGAELPAAIASVKNTTAEEFLRQMNKMPLFMTELDETGEDDDGENIALEAIKALQEEGEPSEVRTCRSGPHDADGGGRSHSTSKTAATNASSGRTTPTPASSTPKR